MRSALRRFRLLYWCVSSLPGKHRHGWSLRHQVWRSEDLRFLHSFDCRVFTAWYGLLSQYLCHSSRAALLVLTLGTRCSFAPGAQTSCRMEGCVGPKSDVDFTENRKISYSCQEPKKQSLRHPARSLVTTLTELPQLPLRQTLHE